MSMADDVENPGDLFDSYPSSDCHDDNLVISIESLFAILDEDPGQTQSRGADTRKGLYEGKLAPYPVDPDNTFQPQDGYPKYTADLEDFNSELGSSEWDKSNCLEASDCKKETDSGFIHPKGNFNSLNSSCHPYSIDNGIRHDSQRCDSENIHSVASNYSSDWLELSTLDCNSRSMGLVGGSVDLMNVNLNHQQLHNNMPDCSADLDSAEGEGLSCSHYADFGNSFFLDVDEEKDFGPMEGEMPFQTGVKEFVSDADTVSSLHVMQNCWKDPTHTLLVDNSGSTDVLYTNMSNNSAALGTDANLPGIFHNEMKMAETTNTLFHANGSCLTLHEECATDDAKNELRQFLSSQFCQPVVSNEKEVIINMKDKMVDQLFPSQDSCRSGEVKLSLQEESLGAQFSIIDLDSSLPKKLCVEQDHCEDIGFRGESSTDSSPLPSGRNSTSDNVVRSVVDMSKHLMPDSKINLLSRRQHTFLKNEREDRMSVSWYKQQENSKGSNNTVHRTPSRSSISVEDEDEDEDDDGDDDNDNDGDICILDHISDPAHPPLPPVHVKPHPILQRPGYGDPCHSGLAGMRLKADDERLTFRIALQDLSQPKSEASPQDGVLAVPLLRHQRIALSWMVQRETASLNYCSGGILADDQGLGKTISTIALILMERSPSAKSCSATGKQNDFEALNLDDDDDVSDLHLTKQPRNSSPVMMTGPAKRESPMVVKSRPAAGTLVVCPTSVLRQWADELQNKVTSKANLSFIVYHGSNRTRDPNELAKYDVVLTTYAIVSMEVPKQPLVDKDGKEGGKTDASGVPSKKRKHAMSSSKNMKDGSTVGSAFDSAARPLARVGWFRVILDEAQSIKNHRTQVARACWGLRAKRRWCLSGTPIQNAVDDLYSYFRFLRFDPYDVYKSFCSRIKMPISKNPATGYKRLQAVLKTIMLRRTKGMLLDGKPIITLPPKTVTLKKVDFSNEERAFYSTLEAESREQFKVYAAAGTVKQNYVNILLMLLRLRQACDHPFLVRQYDSNSAWRSSLEMVKKLPKEKQKILLSHLEASMAICTICNDPPEDAVVTICGHVFCNQCISEHLSGDDNICPSAHCKVRLNLASVFSKGTLFSSLSDLPVDESRSCDSGSNLLDTANMSRDNLCSNSSKIKAALEILLSLPRIAHPSPGSNTDQSNREACGTLQNAVKTVSLDHSMDTGDRKCTDSNEGSDVQVTEKAIVFSQWTRMLDLLEVPLKDSCIRYRRLDGTMSVSAREKAVKDFNTLPEVTVMIMSLKAASLGLNMVAACHVLLLDLWWNPTTEDQAIDRAHRIGQTRPVIVSRLTVKDTVEDRILALQEKKREMVASAFGEDESGSRQSRLTVEDLEYLFNP